MPPHRPEGLASLLSPAYIPLYTLRPLDRYARVVDAFAVAKRVRSAILNAQLDFPQRRITINLAPGDVRKAGPAFDLPIALGMLVATGQLLPEQLRTHDALSKLKHQM